VRILVVVATTRVKGRPTSSFRLSLFPPSLCGEGGHRADIVLALAEEEGRSELRPFSCSSRARLFPAGSHKGSGSSGYLAGREAARDRKILWGAETTPEGRGGVGFPDDCIKSGVSRS